MILDQGKYIIELKRIHSKYHFSKLTSDKSSNKLGKEDSKVEEAEEAAPKGKQ